ncbi:unnamed protein product [Brassica oleracea var. botrytis]
MRKKKLVRLEMVRRSSRMRADIRIMKACVTYTVVFPLPSWLLSRNWAIACSKQVFPFFFGRFISQYEDHKLSGVGANVMAASDNLLSLNPPPDTRNESGCTVDLCLH